MAKRLTLITKVQCGNRKIKSFEGEKGFHQAVKYADRTGRAIRQRCFIAVRKGGKIVKSGWY